MNSVYTINTEVLLYYIGDWSFPEGGMCQCPMIFTVSLVLFVQLVGRKEVAMDQIVHHYSSH